MQVESLTCLQNRDNFAQLCPTRKPLTCSYSTFCPTLCPTLPNPRPTLPNRGGQRLFQTITPGQRLGARGGERPGRKTAGPGKPQVRGLQRTPAARCPENCLSRSAGCRPPCRPYNAANPRGRVAPGVCRVIPRGFQFIRKAPRFCISWSSSMPAWLHRTPVACALYLPYD